MQITTQVGYVSNMNVGARPRRVEKAHSTTPDPRFESLRALLNLQQMKIQQARARDDDSSELSDEIDITV